MGDPSRRGETPYVFPPGDSALYAGAGYESTKKWPRGTHGTTWYDKKMVKGAGDKKLLNDAH
ncbi:MAG: hypothetical protein NNA22_05695 [Nitrospira sp.]|nr:hypothetical protein [Nitrospira sp.]